MPTQRKDLTSERDAALLDVGLSIALVKDALGDTLPETDATGLTGEHGDRLHRPAPGNRQAERQHGVSMDRSRGVMSERDRHVQTPEQYPEKTGGRDWNYESKEATSIGGLQFARASLERYQYGCPGWWGGLVGLGQLTVGPD
jgi:hypothetical protein